MELRVLRYFLAVAREQSVVRAAESLHLSQPTLSTQIRNMERELGKQLFIRGTKGSRKVILTDEGTLLKQRAEEILDLVKKTESEITLSDRIVQGDIYIGAGETDAIRLLAKAARELQNAYPLIRYHLSSGNAEFVMEQLDKGLIDFGIVFGQVDAAKYNVLKMPTKERWGILMRRDFALASKESIAPEDLWDKPLIVSHQKNQQQELGEWLECDLSKLNIVATYNLLYNASLLVDEGLGYAVGFDKIINTTGSRLCFRPLKPDFEIEMSILWKKHQVFSKASKKFMMKIRELQQRL